MSKRTCSIEKCANKHYARGLCRKHYQQFRKSKDFTYFKRDVCSIEGCSRLAKGYGWCNTHYQRWKRNGDPNKFKPRYTSPEQAFSEQTEWRGECLVWTGLLTDDGYGRIHYNGDTVGVHRYAWETANGPIPSGMEINHKCWTPNCVNAKHLELATRRQNTAYRDGANTGSYSGIRNVYRVAGKWLVKVMSGGKFYYFGNYNDLNEAAKVAEQARQKLFGEFAGRG